MYKRQDQHCVKAREILAENGADERLIHAVVSHGYGLVADVPPEYEMEKVLFAVDELTGLIGAAARMRPSGSVQDMELKSLKKKYKSPSFAAGCSREVIARGAEMLGWELDTLLERTLAAMKLSLIHIWVGGAAGGIYPSEFFDDRFPEQASEVEYVVRDAEARGHGLRVLDSHQRSAGFGRFVGIVRRGARIRPEQQGGAPHRISLLQQQGGGHGAVHRCV